MPKHGRKSGQNRIATESIWKLRSNVSWPQVRNAYAHVIRKLKNQEIGWGANWDDFERHIYDKIALTTKTEKTKKSGGEMTWFCKNFQKPEGCVKESPHMAKVGNSFKQVLHICANCWLKDKQKKFHPESSVECPHKEA